MGKVYKKVLVLLVFVLLLNLLMDLLLGSGLVQESSIAVIVHGGRHSHLFEDPQAPDSTCSTYI